MCEICLKNPCDYRCPNYTPQNTHYYCSECGEIIAEGETYFENVNGDMCHAECILDNWSAQDVLCWLDEKMKIMESPDGWME